MQDQRSRIKWVGDPGRHSVRRGTGTPNTGWAHAVIVPTTSRFIEGLAMTAVEAVLAGRPAVVSSVVPAWEVLGDAVIKADTDNIESFAEAIRKLAGNVEAYRSCLRAGSSVKGQFYDRSRGPGAVIVRAIRSMR